MSKALEQCYLQYHANTEFFVIYLASRDPSGYWLHVSDTHDLQDRAVEAHNCPFAKELTFPRLLDDEQGTADYLYRAFPFRVCIVDINGRIAYFSPDERDGERKDLDQVIKQTLEPLQTNGGKATAQMLAQGRCDAAGKPAAGFWLPRVDYFSSAAKKSTASDATLVDVVDARGKNTRVPAGLRDDFLHKRMLVTRLFTRGAPASNRPVVLIFANNQTLTAGAATARVEQFYRQHRSSEDCYLIYAPAKPAHDPAVTATVASAWLRAGKLTIPCLLDTPENEVSYAYGATSARLFVVAQDAQKHWVVRYASQPGALARGLTEAERVLHR